MGYYEQKINILKLYRISYWYLSGCSDSKRVLYFCNLLHDYVDNNFISLLDVYLIYLLPSYTLVCNYFVSVLLENYYESPR